MRFFTKKSKAVKNWHSRAMVIDLSKTKVIMIKTEDLDNNVPSKKRRQIRRRLTTLKMPSRV